MENGDLGTMEPTSISPLLYCSTFACILAMAPAWAANTHADNGSSLRQISIEPSDIHETCMQLTPPQRLHYAFTATDELAFNIHYHANHQAIYPLAEHLTSQANATFTPESGQHYCLMWTNQGGSVIELSLQQEILAKPD